MDCSDHRVSRRRFVHRAGRLAATAGFSGGLTALRSRQAAADSSDPLPRRVLGRTGLSVTTMCLGTAPAGIAKSISAEQVAGIVSEAIDLGINIIDTSERYGNAEEGVGMVMQRRRSEVILATKIWADTVPEAERKLAEAFGRLKTDYADILYFHNLGQRDMSRALEPDGVFPWLVAQKKAGKCRFVAVSAHNVPERFLPFLKTGEVDVVMMTLNFADRFTYGFEEKVLPVAREQNVGVVAMKVFGAPDPATGSWGNPNAKPNVGLENVEIAIRYALSLPGVATANLGVHTREQLRQNVQFVKRFKPLSEQEQSELDGLGRQLAAKWGPHFGPVADEPA